MSDRDDTNTPTNVYDFGRLTGRTGFTSNSADPSTTGDPLGPVIPPPPVNGTGGRARRSPLQSLDALPSPALTRSPMLAAGLPDTFRNASGGGGAGVAPSLGALSMAAVIATVVAALRGASQLLEDRRQRRLEKAEEAKPLREAKAKHRLAMAQARFGSAEAAAKNGMAADQAAAKHQQAMRGVGDKNVEKRAKDSGKGSSKKVPSSQEFGRKASGGGKGASGGAGAGTKGTGNKGAGPSAGRGNKAGAGAGPQSGKGRGSGGDKSAGGGAKKPLKKPELGGGRGKTGQDRAGVKQNSGGKGTGGDKKTAPLKKPADPRKSADGKGLDKPARQKSPMRGSQGAGADLKKKAGQGAGDTGKGRDSKKQPAKPKTDRTKLPQALKDTAQKAADRRLNNRRTNPDKPAAWKRDNAKAGSDSKKKPDPNKDPKSTPKPGTDKPGKVDLTKNKPGAMPGDKGTPPRKVDLNKGKAGDRNSKSDTGTPGRTKLWDAFKKDTKAAANDRWARRGGDRGVPPLWRNDKRRQKKQQAEEPKRQPRSPQDSQGASTGSRNRWQRARDRARNARPNMGGWGNDGCFGGTGTPPSSGPGASTGSAGGHSRPHGTRQSPSGHASRAGRPRYEPIFRDDEPGDQPGGAHTARDAQAIAPDIPALPPAPERHTKRPGTSRPKEAHRMPPAPVPAQDPRLRKARKMAARSGQTVTRQARRMDARHTTEITLDDALDEYGHFKDDAFKTHAACAKLSGRARKLRDTLQEFSDVLAAENNLIGAMFTGAMANLSESMDLVARMADEMELSSLEAAEMSESADNDLNDAYRPITQATADANLTTPSAPVHNQS